MKFEAFSRDVWSGRRVLLTGHTGFKGVWTALLLKRLGANVTGVSLCPEGSPNLFEVFSPWSELDSVLCDIRDFSSLQSVIKQARPEIVIHMAAQALVKEAYADPVGTIGSNVMGTIHLLESLCGVDGLLGALVITSDKVYENQEAGIEFAETAPLGGHDPYSASKAAVEILTHSYQRSFFAERGIPVMTARAGNVIGGGDWACDRLIPDLWRAYESNTPVFMRNPDAVRPWQHVLDPIYGYLLYIQHMVSATDETPASLNFGPPSKRVRTVLQVAEQFAASMEAKDLWTLGKSPNQLYESGFLSIDSTQAYDTLGWKTSLPVDEAIHWTCDWYRAFYAGQDMRSFTEDQIDAYADRVHDTALPAHAELNLRDSGSNASGQAEGARHRGWRAVGKSFCLCTIRP